MPLPKEYYFNKLYPLQDEVLRIVAGCSNDFYLTGGTALSRFYLQHRFSDDLDFFVNGAKDFGVQSEAVLFALGKSPIRIAVIKKAADFVRITCTKGEIDLRIDFVNDIPYRSGSTEIFALFPRVDSWWNILSNKITALERREPKDVADILFICRSYRFAWESVFTEARNKTTYIDPLDISVILSEFPKEFLAKVQWSNDLNMDEALKDIQRVAKDILSKGENSLVDNSPTRPRPAGLS